MTDGRGPGTAGHPSRGGPRTSVPFDRIAGRYDETRGGLERGVAVAAALTPYLPRDAPALEVGVGTAAVAVVLAGRGLDVYGVDLSLPMLARARERLGPRVVAGDAARLPIAPSTVHSAYSVWVLHLVADVTAVLAEVARVLRPGGRYVVVGRRRGDAGPPDDDVEPILADLDLDLRGEPDAPDRVARLAADVGLTVTARTEVASHPYQRTPAEAIAAVVGRDYSALWDLDEQLWSARVEPALAALRALPGQHRPRTTAARYPLLVLTAAGA